MKKIIRKTPLSILAALVIVGCGVAVAGKPAYQASMEKVSDKIANQLVTAVPYPVDQMRDSLERRQLRERLLRFNKSSKLGYLYWFINGSKEPVGYYVIKGKVSSVQSDMTNPDQTWEHDCGTDCGWFGDVESIGDDGSWGNNEGGDDGIFFFDSKGAIHEIGGQGQTWHYSDAPIAIWKDTPDLTAKQNPSSTSAFWKRDGGLGGG